MYGKDRTGEMRNPSLEPQDSWPGPRTLSTEMGSPLWVSKAARGS